MEVTLNESGRVVFGPVEREIRYSRDANRMHTAFKTETSIVQFLAHTVAKVGAARYSDTTYYSFIQ